MPASRNGLPGIRPCLQHPFSGMAPYGPLYSLRRDAADKAWAVTAVYNR